MQIIGHRGSAGTVPENTLLGIKAALEAGVPWIEIDVRYAAAELFVIHDDDVARTTNGAGSIYDLSRQQIEQLDAGNGQTIPKLSEVMDAIDAEAGLNIELKDCRALRPCLAMVRQYLKMNPKWESRLMLSTFERSIHQELARNLPAACRLGMLMEEISDNPVSYAKSLGAYSLNLSRRQLNKALVEQAHSRGLKVFVYTVNNESDIDECLRVGVDAIYTDFPARTLRLVEIKSHGNNANKV